ncbi:integrase core domain-containing protein [Boseongicola aestuarii]|uniref:integrase core domain-containing protein n=1 Tax=Boseongicola aestuarii TaxID=1470561 RepID=UPI000BB455D3
MQRRAHTFWRKRQWSFLRKNHEPAAVNGPEFIATPLQSWLRKVGIQPVQIYPDSPRENGSNERSNGTLRREVLNAKMTHRIKRAQVCFNVSRKQYNQFGPYHSQDIRSPVTETFLEKAKISSTDI